MDPVVAGRIVEVFPLGEEGRYDSASKPPSGMLLEHAIVELDSGERLLVFVPDLVVEPHYMGPRCLITLNAFLGEHALQQLTDGRWEHPREWGKQAVSGGIVALRRNGVVLRTDGGTIAITEVIDDRFEPGYSMRADGFRLDFRGVSAIAAEDGSWVTLRKDPYADIERAFHAFRKGEIEERRFPSVVLDDKLRPVEHGEATRKLLWGESLSVFIYRLGEAQMAQAEPEVAGALDDDDIDVRRAAAWVISRYWRMTRYLGRLVDIACDPPAEGRFRTMAAVGAGILARGSHDTTLTRRFVGLLRDRRARWYVRQAAYLALLGTWLPQTTDLRNSWRNWAPWRVEEDKRFRSWDRWAATRIDWNLVKLIERER